MDNDIKILIERFMAGQTSIEEEDRIAEYFRTHDVDDNLREYKEMFAWFDEGMPLNEAPVSNEGNTKAANAGNVAGKKHGKAFIKAVWITVAAAAIALMVIITLPRHEVSDTDNAIASTGQPKPKQKATQADTITADTVKSAMPKSKKRKRGIRIDRYKPLPPKVYIAEAEQDSTRNIAEAKVDTDLQEMDRQQEEKLKEIYYDYKLMDINIELYLTALENFDVEEEYY